MNGLLVSDKVGELGNLFPDVPQASSPKQMAELVKIYLEDFSNLEDVKARNRKDVLDNHTYVNRVELLLKL